MSARAKFPYKEFLRSEKLTMGENRTVTEIFCTCGSDIIMKSIFIKIDEAKKLRGGCL